MASPTTRSLELLRREGWQAQVVEHWIPYCNVRKDLFGCIDVVGIREGMTIGIQATSGSGGNAMARVHKIMELEHSKLWLLAGNMLEVWAWVKKGAKGKRKLWAVNRYIITPEDFP